jgi:outer membrane protein insertion porin family
MKKPLLPLWLFWVCLFGWLPCLRAQQITPHIHKILIRYVGPPAVSDDFVRANIRAKEGEPLFRATVDQDIAALYRTGYFLQIRVDQNDTPDGVDVTYVLQGKPILTSIKIEGNHKMSLKKLQKKLTSKVGQPLDEQKLFEDSLAMQKLYENAGYQDTKVVVQPPAIDEAAGRASVVIEITETPKIRVVDVVFVNAHEFTQRQLRKVLKTRRHWMFSWLTKSGVLKKDQFEDDKDALVEYYQNAGYIDMAIQDVKFDYITPTRMVIRIIVSEGQQYKVGTLDIKGNTIFTTNDFIKGLTIDRQLMKLQMVPGAVFKPDGYNKDTETLRDMYGSRGYLSGDQQGSTVIAAARTANPTARTMDISYNITEGERCYIEKIDIRGNVKTKDKVLRRELAVSPGEVYDMVRVKISKEKLNNLGYFQKVDTSAEDTDVPNRKNLEIGVEEKSTASLTIGAGFSSVESLVGFLEVRQGNFDLFNPPTFTGAGQKFEAKASIGTELQDYELNFTEPWLYGKRLSLNVDLFHRYNYYDSLNSQYTETFDGGTISLTKALFGNLRGTVSYTAEQVHVAINSGFTTNSGTNYVTSPNGLSQYQQIVGPNISTNIFDERGSTFLSKFGFSLNHDTRNNFQQPTSGEQSSINTEVAAAPSDVNFYKVELKTDWYVKGFFPGHVLELGARAGVVDGYGDNDHVPIFERYFLGGLYNLRGFRYRQVGPMDQFGEPLGGDSYFYASAEYSIPIIKYVSFLLFYDIGNVYNDPWSLKAGAGRVSYSDDYGVGLGIVLPVQGGIPLRLYYGIPINHDPNLSSNGRIQIGFGYVHNF